MVTATHIRICIQTYMKATYKSIKNRWITKLVSGQKAWKGTLYIRGCLGGQNTKVLNLTTVVMRETQINSIVRHFTSFMLTKLKCDKQMLAKMRNNSPTAGEKGHR